MQEGWLSITEKREKKTLRLKAMLASFTPERDEPTSGFFKLCVLCNLHELLIKLHIGFSSADLPSMAIHNSGKL